MVTVTVMLMLMLMGTVRVMLMLMLMGTVRAKAMVMVRATVMLMVTVRVTIIHNKGENMKKVIEESEGTAIEEMLGEKITFYCCRYIYTGILKSIDDFSFRLEGARIVYDTGKFGEPDWKDVEAFPKKVWNVTRQSVESFGELK